jgi:hypothetical protein
MTERVEKALDWLNELPGAKIYFSVGGSENHFIGRSTENRNKSPQFYDSEELIEFAQMQGWKG